MPASPIELSPSVGVSETIVVLRTPKSGVEIVFLTDPIAMFKPYIHVFPRVERVFPDAAGVSPNTVGLLRQSTGKLVTTPTGNSLGNHLESAIAERQQTVEL